MTDKNVIKGKVIARDTVHFTNGLRLHLELEGVEEAMASDTATELHIELIYCPNKKQLMVEERTLRCNATALTADFLLGTKPD